MTTEKSWPEKIKDPPTESFCWAWPGMARKDKKRHCNRQFAEWSFAWSVGSWALNVLIFQGAELPAGCWGERLETSQLGSFVVFLGARIHQDTGRRNEKWKQFCFNFHWCLLLSMMWMHLLLLVQDFGQPGSLAREGAVEQDSSVHRRFVHRRFSSA